MRETLQRVSHPRRFVAQRVLLLCWALAACCAQTRAAAVAELQVSGLRCEYRTDPIGLDVVRPRLSWILVSQERGQTQTAVQILAAHSLTTLRLDQGDLWDSGKVRSDQTQEVVYGGKALASRSRVWWKVRVWDSRGRPSRWSEPAHWSMGLLDRSDWQARWIAGAAEDAQGVPGRPAAGSLPATMLRKTFQLDQPVKRATVYVTALGLYELRLNGRRVGDQLLAPEWTSYSNRVQYQTYDVTDLLRPGPNAVAAWLGEGWYAGRLMAVGRYAYGTRPQFLLQLEIELQNGARQKLVTDD